MASDKKAADAPSLEQQVKALTERLADLQRTVHWMQTRGGFADSKTLSVRCSRIEDRLERAEADGEMLKSVAGATSELIEGHLRDRHELNVVEDNGRDTVGFRRTRRLMREWAEKLQLMTKRKDLTAARQDENRLRPRALDSVRDQA